MVMRGRQVVIYGEYLFLENFITGGILLFFTVKLLNRRFSRIRLFEVFDFSFILSSRSVDRILEDEVKLGGSGFITENWV